MGKFSRYGNALYNGRKSIDFIGRNYECDERGAWYCAFEAETLEQGTLLVL